VSGEPGALQYPQFSGNLFACDYLTKTSKVSKIAYDSINRRYTYYKPSGYFMWIKFIASFAIARILRNLALIRKMRRGMLEIIHASFLETILWHTEIIVGDF